MHLPTGSPRVSSGEPTLQAQHQLRLFVFRLAVTAAPAQPAPSQLNAIALGLQFQAAKPAKIKPSLALHRPPVVPQREVPLGSSRP